MGLCQVSCATSHAPPRLFVPTSSTTDISSTLSLGICKIFFRHLQCALTLPNSVDRNATISIRGSVAQ